MNTTIAARTRSALIAEFANRILDGEYAPGEKMPSERQIVTITSLSRPVVREVLRGLEERGLITIQPGRGAFVRGLQTMNVQHSIDSFARMRGTTPRQLVQARAMLEGQTAALAAQNATKEEIAALRKLAANFDEISDVIARARCDMGFHSLIAKASHNLVIETMFGSIAPLIFEMQLRSLDDRMILDIGAPLHHDIVRGIAERKPEIARTAMLKHVELADKLFGDDFDRSLDSIARGKISKLLGQQASLEEVIVEALEMSQPDS